MTAVTKRRLARLLRGAAAVLLLSLLAWFRALWLPHFHLGLAAFLLGGYLAARRTGNRYLLPDAGLAYLALFLLPPGFIGWSLSFAWSAASVLLAVLLGLLARFLAERRSGIVLTVLITLAVTSAGATVTTFQIEDRPMPTAWTGYPALLDDAGWDGARVAPKLVSCAPQRRVGELPEAAPHGDPPGGRVFGLLERGDEFSVRNFSHAIAVELNPEKFAIAECLPVLDVDFHRRRREWVVLCGGSRRVVFVGGDGGVTRTIDLPGIWPFRLAVHQDLNRLYITDPATGYLHEIDLETLERVRSPHVGFGISDVAVGPDGRNLYVAQPYRSRVNVLDARDLSSVAEVDAGFGVAHLGVNRLLGRIYAVTMARGTVFVLDPATNEIVARRQLGSPVLDVVVDDGTNRLYWATPRGLRWVSLQKLPPLD